VKQPTLEPLICTIRERCRVCYTCVRECPAKAIRITAGQAAVIVERCIGCGNCVVVCSQKAKDVMSCIPAALQVLECGKPAAAMVAPAFPAEFTDVEPDVLVSMIRQLGFASVHEVLLALFIFLTTPISAHLLVKAALKQDPSQRPPLPSPKRAPAGGGSPEAGTESPPPSR
jgi:ferredoxin